MDPATVWAKFRVWPSWGQAAAWFLLFSLFVWSVAYATPSSDREAGSDAAGVAAPSPGPSPTPSPTPAPTPSPTSDPTPSPSPSPSSTPTPAPSPDRSSTPPPSASAGWTVVNIVDGDTIDVRDAAGVTERVRVIGIDTPERGECGFSEASQALSTLILNRDVELVAGARDDRDRYDRILRYVDVGPVDAGLTLIESGFAIARYDSRDGYGHHPRQERYVAADAANDAFTCAAPAPPPPPTGDGGSASNPWGSDYSCDPAYDPCVPPKSEIGDLNCPDITAKYSGGVRVDHAHGDGHGLDRDQDGHGCE